MRSTITELHEGKNIDRTVRLGLMVTVLAALVACGDSPVAPSLTGLEVGPATSGQTSSSSGAATIASFGNPLAGAKLFVESNSTIARQVAEWRSTRPADAALLEKIASQPLATWMGEWSGNPYEAARSVTSRVRSAGAVPVLVIY